MDKQAKKAKRLLRRAIRHLKRGAYLDSVTAKARREINEYGGKRYVTLTVRYVTFEEAPEIREEFPGE